MKNILETLNNKLELKNRLVYPPMASSMASEEGVITDASINFYSNITSSKHIGLVIVEHSYINMKGKAHNKQTSVALDENVPDLKRLVDAIHANESKVVLQINHAGSATTSDITGFEPLGPSATANPRRGTIPKAFSLEEMKELANDFAQAARRAKEAGFDGVQIHSAHGYLLNQFYSPLSNKREDEYGGSLEKRIKIHLEVIDAVKKEVGEDYPILLRLGACDYTEGGSTIEDAIFATKKFKEAGVDIIDISGGFCGYTPDQLDLDAEGYFYPVTEAIKKEVNIPVILTGGVVTLKGANQLIADEKADLIGVGRAIFKDYSWTQKEFDAIK